MRRIALVIILAAIVLTSCAATMRLDGTAPSTANDAPDCASYIGKPITAGAPIWIIFEWSGQSSGKDSLTAIAGTAFSYTKNLPTGVYQVVCRTRWNNIYSCRDTVITKLVHGNPNSIPDLK